MTRNDIDWPTGFERTHRGDREKTTKFDKGRNETVKEILHELDILGADHKRVETDADHQKRNQNMPYANASPDDPGAVVRWRMDGEDYAVACDHYTDLRDNLRAIFLYINEKRMMDNRPVETGQDEFATARLPPVDGDVDGVAAEPAAHDILGVDPGASDDEVRDAYRDMLTDVHPDHGGGDDEYLRVRRAKEVLLADE